MDQPIPQSTGIPWYVKAIIILVVLIMFVKKFVFCVLRIRISFGLEPTFRTNLEDFYN
jgi:hypothetical protein